MFISVIIPVFNEEKYIRECLNSVMNQTRKVDEVIVVDDGSSDNTVQIAEGFGVKVIKHKKNKGIAETRNTGVKNVSKECTHISFCSGDDVWLPNFLEIMTRTAKQHPNKIIYSNYYVWKSDINEASPYISFNFNGDREGFIVCSWENARMNTMFVNYSCILAPKEVFTKVPFKHRFGEDLYHLLHIMKDYEFWNVPQMLVKYRLTGNLTSQIMDKIPANNKIIRAEAEKHWGIKK